MHGEGPERLRCVIWRLDAIANQQRQLATETGQLESERRDLFRRLDAPAATTSPQPGAPIHGSEWRPEVVRNLLLWLGAALVCLAALIFSVVAWSRLDYTGRAALLIGFTLVAGAGVAATRRKLPATTEALGALGLGLVVVDWYALQRTGLGSGANLELWWAAGLILTTSLAAASGRFVPLASGRLIAGGTGLAAGVILIPAFANASWVISLGWAGVATAGVALASQIDAHRLWRPAAGILATGAVAVDLAAVVMAVAAADAPGFGRAATAAIALAATGLAPFTAWWLARRRCSGAPELLGVLTAAPGFGAVVVLSTPTAHGASVLAVLALLGFVGVLGARLGQGGNLRSPWRGVGIVAAGCSVWAVTAIAPTIAQALFGPFRWLDEPWHGRWATPVLSYGNDQNLDTLADPRWAALTVLGAVALTGLVATTARVRQKRFASPSVGSALAVVGGFIGLVCIAPAADLSLVVAWAVAIGCTLALTLAGTVSELAQRRSTGYLAGAGALSLIPTAGLAMATASTSLATVGLLGSGWLVASVKLNDGWFRSAITSLTSAAFVVAAAATVSAFGGTAAIAGFSLVIAGTILVVSGALRRLPARTGRILDLVGGAGLAVGGLLALQDPLWSAATLSVATVGFGVAGWVSERRWYYLRGALTLVLACWAWFSWADVSLLEAYSLPPAIVAGAVGWFVRRQREAAGSWLSYGPALVVGFVPSLFEALDNGGVRALILVGAGVAAVLLGAANRLQSPLVVGATVIAAIAIDTLWPVALRVPRWAAIGGAGIVFLWLGATAERRLSQLRGLAKQYESLG